MATYQAIRRTYGTPTSVCFDSNRCHNGTCSSLGQVTCSFQAHTLFPTNPPGGVEVNNVCPGSNVYTFQISGRDAAGSIEMRFEGSANGTFGDAVILAEGTVTFPHATVNTVCLDLTLVGPSQPCQFGVQLQPQVPGLFIITALTVATVTGKFNAPWLDTLFNILVGSTFDASFLCSRLPPPVPVISTTTLAESVGSIRQIWDYLAWFSFCQCTPGAPTPVPPVQAPLTQPPQWIVGPPLPADPTNETESHRAIMLALQELLAREAAIQELVELIQRQHVPFGVVPGRTIAGLEGQSTFGIDRLIGLQISLTAVVPGSGELFGNPPYLLDQGWVSVSDGGAMLEEIRLTRGRQSWYPHQMQLATIVGVSLRPGAVATIVELIREP